MKKINNQNPNQHYKQIHHEKKNNTIKSMWAIPLSPQLPAAAGVWEKHLLRDLPLVSSCSVVTLTVLRHVAPTKKIFQIPRPCHCISVIVGPRGMRQIIFWSEVWFFFNLPPFFEICFLNIYLFLNIFF